LICIHYDEIEQICYNLAAGYQSLLKQVVSRQAVAVDRQLQEDQGYVQAEDDNPAHEVAIAAVVAEIRRPIAHAVPDDPMNGEEVDDPIEYEEGFIPWGDVVL